MLKLFSTCDYPFMTRTRALLILLLSLILPLQGLAAALAPLHRASNADAVSALPCHELAVDAGAQPSSGHAPDSNTPVSDIMAHACCHPVFSCAPAACLMPTARKFSDVPRFVLPLATLYIPDSPDRPPRG